MDFDFMSADIDTTPQQPSHHKKHSTFANVPFAETHGLDDFIGFSATETELNQEIKDLKDKVQSQQDLIDVKDLLILQLRNENSELKNQLANMNSQFQIETHNNDSDSNKSSTLSPIASNDKNTLGILNTKSIIGIPSILRPSPTSITTEGSALFSKISNKKKETDDELKHQISASLNNFLDTLDFKFKEDENEHKLTDENENEIEEEYIYNPTAIMDIDGHLPQLRRSSLSEEEQERMELEAVNQLKNHNNNNNGNDNKQYVGNSPYNNVIFNDSNVNNMNMNIINHHNHMSNHNHNHNKDTNINSLKMEILQLTNIIQQMRKTKIQLIMTTENEINRLRTIIRTHIN